jgi:2-dehydro-3-deoxyphosphogluconate aldolase/(4S)-4-hydroxy-2-oxoglutarate aldolase
MTKAQTVFSEIGRHRIVPVVAIGDAEQADPLGDALVAGGLPVAEITFRTDAAEAALRALAQRGDMLVGAGTVLTVRQAKTALDAGAQFIVSPGFSSEVVDYCLDQGIPITPGCATPSDLHQAVQRELSVVKFFPAEAMGGLKMLKALSAPFGGMKFVPTGGINADNLSDYLTHDAVLACGGSWMVKRSLLDEGRFDEVTRLTREAVAKAQH